MKRDSLRLAIPKLLKPVQIMYQTGEISGEEKDWICREFMSGKTDAVIEKMQTLSFFGSETAGRLLEELQFSERSEALS